MNNSHTLAGTAGSKIISFANTHREYVIRILLLTALVLMPPQLLASVIYSYTGNNYTDLANSEPPTGAYSTSMRIQGSTTLATALADGFHSLLGTTAQFQFSDGRTTYTEVDSLSFISAIQLTIAGGLVDSWTVSLFDKSFLEIPNAGDQLSAIESSANSTGSAFDKGRVVERVTGGGLATDFGQVSVGRGVWTITQLPSTSAPEPTTLVLLGLGLAGIGFSRRQSKGSFHRT